MTWLHVNNPLIQGNLMAGNDNNKGSRVPLGNGGGSINIADGVQLREVKYPASDWLVTKPGQEDEIPHYLPKIINKWIYVIQAEGARKCFEFYAGEKKWVQMKFVKVEGGRKFGELSDRNRHNSKLRDDVKVMDYFVFPQNSVTESEGTFCFFVSPVQLSRKALSELDTHAVNYANKLKKYNNWNMSGKIKERKCFTHTGAFDITKPCTVHKAKPKGDKATVLVIDPFAWAEDCHKMAYQWALEQKDKYANDETEQQRYPLAKTIKSLLNSEEHTYKSPMYSKLAAKSSWLETNDMPQPQISGTATLGIRKMEHKGKANAEDWKIANAYEKGLDFYLKAYALKSKMFVDYANNMAHKLVIIVLGIRYKIVEISCIHAGGDALAYAIVHWGLISFRLAESAAGAAVITQLMRKNHSRLDNWLMKVPDDDQTSLIQQVLALPNKRTVAAKKWWKPSGPIIKDARRSTVMLIANTAGVIQSKLTQENSVDLYSYMKDVIEGNLNLKIKTKLFTSPEYGGRSIERKLPKLDESSRLKDAVTLFGDYKVADWYGAGELKLPGRDAIKALNVILALSTEMKSKSTTKAQFHSALGFLKYALDNVAPKPSTKKFHEPLTVDDPKKTGGLNAQEKATKQTLSRVAGFLDVYLNAVAMRDSLENLVYKEAENAGQLTGQIILASASASSTITSTMMLLRLGTSLTTGPLGWISLGLTVISIIGAEIYAAFTQSDREKIIDNSHFGRRINPAPPGIPRIIGAASIAAITQRDHRTILTNLATFRIEGTKDGPLTFFPGYTSPETEIELNWIYDIKKHKVDIKLRFRVGDCKITYWQSESILPKGVSVNKPVKPVKPVIGEGDKLYPSPNWQKLDPSPNGQEERLDSFELHVLQITETMTFATSLTILATMHPFGVKSGFKAPLKLDGSIKQGKIKVDDTEKFVKSFST
jgi:hypothetical protein